MNNRKRSSVLVKLMVRVEFGRSAKIASLLATALAMAARIALALRHPGM